MVSALTNSTKPTTCSHSNAANTLAVQGALRNSNRLSSHSLNRLALIHFRYTLVNLNLFRPFNRTKEERGSNGKNSVGNGSLRYADFAGPLLGIVGYGDIGRAEAKRAHAVGMHILRRGVIVRRSRSADREILRDG
jgi:hypothetical protein